jgi:hypothetical protein
MHIVNNDGSINKKTFILDNKEYKINATRSVGWRAIQAIDTIKNTKTGKTKEINRIKLFLLTRKKTTK